MAGRDLTSTHRERNAAGIGDTSQNNVLSEDNSLLPPKKSGERQRPSQHTLRQTSGAPEVKHPVVAKPKPLSWQDVVPKQRRSRSGSGAMFKLSGSGRPLFHFSPPSSLLANVNGIVGHTGKRDTPGVEGTQNESPRGKTNTKTRTGKGRSNSGSQTRRSGRDESYARSNRNTSKAEGSAAHLSASHSAPTNPEQEASYGPTGKTKAAKGKGLAGRPSFKITSLTPRKKKSSAGPSTASSRTSAGGQRRNRGTATAASTSSSSQNAGSVFLRHLNNFRPIREGSDRLGGGSVAGAVNYQGWMRSNASAVSSYTSHEDVDVSSMVLLDSGRLSGVDNEVKNLEVGFLSSSHASVGFMSSGEDVTPAVKYVTPVAEDAIFLVEDVNLAVEDARHAVFDTASAIENVSCVAESARADQEKRKGTAHSCDASQNPYSSEEASQTCDADLWPEEKRTDSFKTLGEEHNLQINKAAELVTGERYPENCLLTLSNGCDEKGSKFALKCGSEAGDCDKIGDCSSKDKSVLNVPAVDPAAAVTIAAGQEEAAADDLAADRELRDVMSLRNGGGCGSLSPLAPALGGTRSTKCLTPNVRRAVSAPRSLRGSYSNDCSFVTRSRVTPDSKSRISASSLSRSDHSSEDSSATSGEGGAGSQDEVTKERVQHEFDLRLGKYMSLLLSGEGADCEATRRLQACLLKQRDRVSLPRPRWAVRAARECLDALAAAAAVVETKKMPTVAVDNAAKSEPTADHDDPTIPVSSLLEPVSFPPHSPRNVGAISNNATTSALSASLSALEETSFAASSLPPSGGDVPTTPNLSGRQSEQDNYSFNKREEDNVQVGSPCDTRPLRSKRPHSSPAKGSSLSHTLVPRAPTPTLKHLLKAAAASKLPARQTPQSRRKINVNPKINLSEKDLRKRKPPKPRRVSESADEDLESLCKRSAQLSPLEKDYKKRKPPKHLLTPESTDEDVVYSGPIHDAYCRPTSWNVAAQTDGTGCCSTCGCKPRSRASSASNGAFLTAPTSPSSMEVASIASGLIVPEGAEFRSSLPRVATPGGRGSLRTVSFEEHSSVDSISRPNSRLDLPEKRSPVGAFDKDSPRPGILRSSSLKENRGPSRGHTPRDGKTSARGDTFEDFTDEVSSRVEADLQEYNAVMNRCRALLSEHDPVKEDSSTWTQESEPILPKEGEYDSLGSKPPCRIAADGSMGDVSGDAKDTISAEIATPTITKLKKYSSSVVRTNNIRVRSCSVQDTGKGKDQEQRRELSPRRSASNPHYLGVVEFGSVAAIRRLVDPEATATGGCVRPKVTFDIESQTSGESRSSSASKKSESNVTPKTIDSSSSSRGQDKCGKPSTAAAFATSAESSAATSTSRPPRQKTSGSEKKKRKSASSKGSQKLKDRPLVEVARFRLLEKGASAVTMEGSETITPMTSRRPRTTNDRCTSRKPTQTNPRSNSTLASIAGKTRPPPAPPRPCSQSSWKTIDTDAASRTPLPELINMVVAQAALAREKKKKTAKKKKKKKGNKNEEADNVSESAENKLMKSAAKKKKKKGKKMKPSTGTKAQIEPHCVEKKTSEAPETLSQKEDDVVSVAPPVEQSTERANSVPNTSGEKGQQTPTPVKTQNSGELTPTTIAEPVPLTPPQTTWPSAADQVSARIDAGGPEIASPNEGTPPDVPAENSSPQHTERRSVTFCGTATVEQGASSPSKQGVPKAGRKTLASGGSSSPSRQRSVNPSSKSRSSKPGVSPPRQPLARTSSCGKAPRKRVPIKQLNRTSSLPAASQPPIKYIYRSKRLAGRTTGLGIFPAAQKMAPNTSDTSDIDTSQMEEKLAQYRQQFLSFKGIHSELERNATGSQDGDTKISVLRKCGPLVVALLIQLWVQYTYN